MRAKVLILVLASQLCRAAGGSWHGFVSCDNHRGCAALHNQAEYDQFVERIPKERLQMKQPAPPSDDPLLLKPVIHFEQQTLLAVWSENVHIGCRIGAIHRDGEDVKVEVDFEVPPDYRNYSAPYGFGQYHVLALPAFSGTARLYLSKAGEDSYLPAATEHLSASPGRPEPTRPAR